MNWHSVRGTAFVESENRLLLYQEWENLGHVPLTLRASFPPFENYKDWTRIFLVYDNSQLPSLLPLEAIACISKLQPVAVVCFGKNLPAPLRQAGPVSLRNETRYLPVTHFPLLFPVPASHASAWALLLPRAQAGHYPVHYGFYYWWLLVTEQRNLKSTPVMATLSREKRRATGISMDSLLIFALWDKNNDSTCLLEFWWKLNETT